MVRTLRLECLVLSLLLALGASPARAQWVDDGTPVTNAAGPQRRPGMVADGQGGAYIAWQDENPPTRIFVQRIGPDGRPEAGWPVGGVPIPSSCPAEFRGLVSDGTGGVYVGLSACDAHVPVNVQHLAPDGSIVPGWPTEGPLPAFGYFSSPSAFLTDGAGGLFVCWSHSYSYTDGDGITRSVADLFLQRILPSGQLAPGWPAEGTPVYQGLIIHNTLVSPDGRGGVMAGYTSVDRFGWSGYGTVRRLNGDGSTEYITGLGCPNAASIREVVQIYPDGSGGVMVIFREYSRGGAELIQTTLQRFDDQGVAVTTWTPTCLPFFGTALGSPLIVTDGGSGAFFAWGDTRDSPEPDIYALRLNAAGNPAPGWSAAGNSVCSAPGSQANELKMIADNTGGAILVWVDTRAAVSSTDIFAQRLGPAGPGIAGWPTTGLPVCTASGAQQAIQLVPDGVGGAYVCWEDNRNGASDIYLHRLGPEGPVPVQVSVVGTEVEFDLIRVVWDVASGFAGRISVEKREADGDWSHEGAVLPDGTGRIRYEDRAVKPGGRFGYRLEVLEAAHTQHLGEVWVDMLALAVALGPLSPNPSHNGWEVSLSLAGAGTATLEVIDVQGRVVMSREVGALGPGRHRVRLEAISTLPAGVYSLALRQAGLTATTRGVIAR